MCLEYPPTFRARLATYLSLLVNHVPPPQSGEWTEVLQFKDPGQLERATEEWLETLDNDTGKSGTKITRHRVTKALAKHRDDAQRRKRIGSALGRPSMTTNKTVDGHRPSMLPPPPPKVLLSHSRGATGGGLTCGKVSTKDGSLCKGQQRASYSSKPHTHASTSKRKRMEAGAGTASDTAEKRPRPRPPLPRGVPPNNARSSSSWTSKSGPPGTTNQPKACTPRPPSTPKPRPPNTPKPRPPTTPRPPSMPKPPRRSTPLPPNTPKPKKSFTPPPLSAPKLPVTLAARPPSTHKPRPPTTPKPRQLSTPNLLKKPAPRPPTTPKPLQTSTPLPVTTIKGLESPTHRPPSTLKPIRMPITPPPPCTPKSLTSSAPLPVSTLMPPVTPTTRTPSAPEPKSEPTSCTGPKPPSMPKGANSVTPAGSSRLPPYGKAPRSPSTARPSPLAKAPPATKPKPPPCPRLLSKTHLSRRDSIGASALTKTGGAQDSADGKRPHNGGSSQMAFKAKAEACMESNCDADSIRGGGLDGKAMDRRESQLLAQDGHDNRKRSRDELTEDTSAATQGGGGKRPKTGSDSEGASSSEGDSTSTSSPGKADGTDDDEIEEGEIVEMANRPVFERACAA
ncbi:unnamed protein product [Ectocarpus sp. 8 AP-2014]